MELIRTSATKGTGIDDLLEMLLFIAEDKDYRANPIRQAFGTCSKAQLHEGRGVVSKLIVQNGTMKVGDSIVCEMRLAKLRRCTTLYIPRKLYRKRDLRHLWT